MYLTCSVKKKIKSNIVEIYSKENPWNPNIQRQPLSIFQTIPLPSFYLYTPTLGNTIRHLKYKQMYMQLYINGTI